MLLGEAVKYLAGRCDYATSQSGGGNDGKKIARKSRKSRNL